MKRDFVIVLMLLFWKINFGQTLSFPDPNFENALVNFEVVDTTGNGLGDSVCDTNGDGFIQLSEAEAVMGLIVSYYDIESLEGIEFFSHLETLKSRGNFLTSLDLSQNPALSWLHVETNPLTDLDISQNFLLERLWVYQNELTTLDVSHLPNLLSLRVYSNQLESLNIKNGNNTQLANFLAYDNPLLFCIQVDDEGVANDQEDWQKDETAVYSEDCSLRVSDETLTLNVRLYPNPAAKIIFIESEEPVLSVSIYDSMGRHLFQTNPIENFVNLEGLYLGLYLMVLETSEGRVTKKIVKN